MSLDLGHQSSIGITGRVQDGIYASSAELVRAAMSKMGAMITQDQITQWAIDGRTFHAQQGDAGTKLDFAETAYDQDQPQFALRVPSGKTVLPLSLIVTLEDMAGLINNIFWSTTTNDIGAGGSTELTISPMRRDAPFGSNCTANSLYTTDSTSETGVIEVIRFMNEFAAAATMPQPRFEWNIRQAAMIPVLVGPATLMMHAWGATALQGWGEYTWAEFDTPALITLA